MLRRDPEINDTGEHDMPASATQMLYGGPDDGRYIMQGIQWNSIMVQ